MTDKTTTEQPKKESIWQTTANILQECEKKRFWGTIELKMEAGRPVFAKVTEGVKLV